MQGDSNSSATPTAACIDAETLAAWADGGLTTDEAALVETHLADCDRCTAMAATFARTLPATPTAATESLWKRWHLRWLVPIATAATVASLWVLIPRQQPAPTATLDSAPAAAPKAPAPSAPASSVQSSSPVEPKEQEQKKSEEAPRAPERFRDESRADADEKRVQQPSLNEAITVAPTPPKRETDRVEPQKPIGDTEFPRAAAQSAGAAAPPPAAAAPPPAAPEAAGERVRTFGAAVGRAATIIDIVSPDPNVRWRVVGAGQVERSTTGGRQWERATLPESATLTAGSSPSPTVCWLVGRTGAIYVTTDGLRFMRVPFAERTDFLRIEAIDARRATLVTSDGRTMRTDDQGATWTRISP